MKTLTRTLQTVIAIAVMFAMPHLASAAVRTFTSVTPSPASTNVSAGVATTNTSTVSVRNGSGASTRFIGTALLTVSVSPSEPTVVASISPTNLVFLNADTTLTSTLTVTTTAGTPVNTYVVQIVADTNYPPGVNIAPKTNFFTLNVGAVFVPQKVWSPAGVNTNWSTSANWTNSGVPTLSNDVVFVDLGAVGTPGTVDNVVDSSFTIGSLTYGQTNNYHTTLVPSGVTLTVGGTAGGLVVGTGTDPGNGLLTTAAITGAGGKLTVTNKSVNVNVGQAHSTTDNAISSAQATLDLSGLDEFTATVSRLVVGVDLTIRGSSGVLNLAKTNTLTATAGSAAPQIDVGDNSQASGTPTISSILRLGQTNGLYADSVVVGRGKTDGTGALMQFNSTFTSPTAYFRGTNGSSSRVGIWFIGDGYGSRTYWAYGTCDFSLGTVDALVDTMYVGRGASEIYGNGANNPGYGTLTFSAGTIDVNTLQVGYSTANAAGTGTVNANGGSLLVNTLFELGHSGGSATLNVSNSTVTANSGITVGGPATIAMIGGTLNATNSSSTIGAGLNPISNLSVSNSTFGLAIQSLVPSVAAANLAVDGTANTINISSIPPLPTPGPAQFPIVQYGLNGGSSSGDLTKFVLGTLPSGSPAYGAYVSNNVANKSIDIVITNGPFIPSLTWNGTPNGNWNTTTANWKLNGGPSTNYAQGNFVTFDDTLTGTASVNLTTALSPILVTVNNSVSNYVFSGTGNISGSAPLVKSGSGTLTLAETGGDNFSGGILVNNGTLILDNANSSITGNTTINGGTVQVGNNDTNGRLPSGNVTDTGALVFNRADNIVASNVISGAGTLMQSNATSVLTLTGDNSSFAGAPIVAQGTLQIGSSNSVFATASGITVIDGATLDTGGQALYNNINTMTLTVSGAGVGGNGAIVNTGGNGGTNSPAQALHIVTMTGDTTFGGTVDWDIRNSSGKTAPADAQLNGAYNLTKAGTNSVQLRDVTIDSGLKNINVQAGGLTISGTTNLTLTSFGDPSYTVKVFTNATLTLDTIGTIPSKNFILTNGGTLKCSGTNSFGNPLTLAGAANNTINVGSGAKFTITSAIGGGGGFSKNGTNALFLTAANTYSGNTIVSGGTLALYGGGFDGSISSSVNINITSGATVDVSGRSNGTLTLASGQTLIGGLGTNGPGAINGILVASAGSFIAPGVGSTNTGSLTVSSNATLQGATTMKLSASSGANDQLSAYAITGSGSLSVTNFSGTLTNGQTFQLFVATNGNYSGLTFSGGVTLPSATGLTWTNTLAVDGKITAGVTPPAQPIITSITLSGTNLVISGTGGTAASQFVLLNSTNLTLPLSQWTPVVTNTFTGGSWSTTNTVNPSAPQNFYMLKVF